MSEKAKKRTSKVRFFLDRKLAAFDDDVFDHACASPSKGSCHLVFLRLKTSYCLSMRGKLDDHKPMEVLRAFHDLVFAATGQYLATMSRQNTNWNSFTLTRSRLNSLYIKRSNFPVRGIEYYRQDIHTRFFASFRTRTTYL